MSFEALKFLSDYDIPHREHGQKTTKGWVQIEQCPFCYGDNYYLGVNVRDSFFHCWMCNKSGKIEWLIYKLLKTSYTEAKKITEEYGGPSYEEAIEGHAERVEIQGWTNLRPMHIDYLEKRGFDHKFLERRYRIGANYTVGRFPYRIVIPIYDDGILLNATARDVTDQQTERYLSLRNDEAVTGIKECVYNIDSLKGDNVLIVEGPFDVWRIGGATVSLFGTAFKTAQVMRILSKFPKNVFIIFDSEPTAQKNANALGACFSPFVEKVEIMEIPVKDPAMLSKEDALNIRNELKL